MPEPESKSADRNTDQQPGLDNPGGWGFPYATGANKAHYFPEPGGPSLCRRYGSFMTKLRPRPSRTDDCSVCRRKFDALAIVQQ